VLSHGLREPVVLAGGGCWAAHAHAHLTCEVAGGRISCQGPLGAVFRESHVRAGAQAFADALACAAVCWADTAGGGGEEEGGEWAVALAGEGGGAPELAARLVSGGGVCFETRGIFCEGVWW
jgi:hypothetical protein